MYWQTKGRQELSFLIKVKGTHTYQRRFAGMEKLGGSPELIRDVTVTSVGEGAKQSRT